MKSYLRAPTFALLASALTCCYPLFAEEAPEPIKLCQSRDRQDNGALAPLTEVSKSVALAEIGTRGGHISTSLATTYLAKGLFIREVGVVAGQMLVGIFEASNPVAVAFGFILEPSVSAKCDTFYTDDPDCLKQNPCLQPLPAPPDRH